EPREPSVHSLPSPPPSAEALARAVHPAGSPGGGVVGTQSAGRMVFRTTLWNASGLVENNWIVADPSNGLIYSANSDDGSITSFSPLTLARGPSYDVFDRPNLGFPVDLALDPIHHYLDVAVATYTGAGYLLELNLSTLSAIGTLPLPVGMIPQFLAFDPSSDQILVANSTGSVAVVSPVLDKVMAVLSTGCNDPSHCFFPQLVPIPRHQEVALMIADQTYLDVINTSTDTLVNLVSSSAWYSAIAYDPIHDVLWAADTAYSKMSAFNPVTGGLVGEFNQSSGAQGIAVDATDGNVFVIDSNGTLGQEIWEYTFGGLHVAHYLNLSSNQSAYSQVVCGSFGSTDLLITAGGPNDTTQEFQLFQGVPHLASFRSVPSNYATVFHEALDPELGLAYALTSTPNTVTAYRESDGSTAWVRAFAPGYYPTSPDLVADPSTDRVFTNAEQGGQLIVLNGSDGTVSATVPTIPMGLYYMAVDEVHHWLYVGGQNLTAGTAEVQVLSITGAVPISLGLVVLPTPSDSICGLAVDPVRAVVYANNCSRGAAVFEISEGSMSIVHTFPVGNYPRGEVVGSNGDVYICHYMIANVTVLDPVQNRTVGNLSVGYPFYTLNYWPEANILLGASFFKNVTLVNLTTGMVIGNVTLPGYDYSATFDPVTDTLHSITGGPSAQFEATFVPAPSTPRNVVAVAGNDSANLSWTAGVAASDFPVTVTAFASTSGGSNVSAELTTSPASFSGLTNGRTYAIVLAASSAAGTSPSTVPQTLTPAGIPYPPTSVSLIGTAEGFSVYWNPPASDDGSPVVNYSVHYSAVGSGTWSIFQARTSLHAEIGGVALGVPVAAYVVATNSLGTSHPSASIIVDTGTPGGASSGAPGGWWVDTGILVVAAIGGSAAITWIALRRASRPPPSPRAVPPPPP
ncbi:MAG: fibronectin type III domain-containing protein, partial [Thermoplasmata archaeon]|nr:fibronectin type III domain-containing protein [Thermoplasmata archaeon]